MRTRLISGALLVSAAALTMAPADAAECLSYGAEVTLTGYFGSAVFPGSPNFESVKDGDAAERAALLFLNKPFCTGEDPEGMGEPQPSVDLVQLACESDQLSGFEKSEGTPVTVKGKLFAAHTGHHHTAVLLACD